jgi:hypothetical protein
LDIPIYAIAISIFIKPFVFELLFDVFNDQVILVRILIREDLGIICVGLRGAFSHTDSRRTEAEVAAHGAVGASIAGGSAKFALELFASQTILALHATSAEVAPTFHQLQPVGLKAFGIPAATMTATPVAAPAAATPPRAAGATPPRTAGATAPHGELRRVKFFFFLVEIASFVCHGAEEAAEPSNLFGDRRGWLLTTRNENDVKREASF